jgi:histidinol dehydrogenase
VASQVVNAGSVFLGHYSPESAGDYASGTNHSLPTSGFARSYGGVSLDSFIRKITFQNLTSGGFAALGPHIQEMANAEGLFAHMNAATLRLNNLNHV